MLTLVYYTTVLTRLPCEGIINQVKLSCCVRGSLHTVLFKESMRQGSVYTVLFKESMRGGSVYTVLFKESMRGGSVYTVLFKEGISEG